MDTAASLISVDEPNIVIETVKKAENSESLIIRCYECYNRRTKVNMKIGMPVDKVCVVNPLEDQILEELETKDGIISFVMKPYEIRTLKFDAM